MQSQDKLWDLKLEIKDKPFSKPQILKFRGKNAINELVQHIKEKYGLNGDE